MKLTKGIHTKLAIIRIATTMFLEKGVSATSAKAVCEQMNISTGNLTFHFKTKEDILAVLVKMLCQFQWEMMTRFVDEGKTSLLAVCLEFAAMASMCEDDPVAKDFYLAAYSHPVPLGILRNNDKQRAKMVFGEYCPDWNDQQFSEAEILVSGTEYATFMTAGDAVSLEMRIAGALDNIMTIYHIPEETRKIKIHKILTMDYHSLGKRILQEFRHFVEEMDETHLQEYIQDYI